MTATEPTTSSGASAGNDQFAGGAPARMADTCSVTFPTASSRRLITSTEEPAAELSSHRDMSGESACVISKPAGILNLNSRTA